MGKAEDKQSHIREGVKIAVGLLITGLALYLFFRSVDPRNILSALKKVSVPALLICVALTLASLYVRALRFKFMLPDRLDADKRNIFPIVTIAFMINNILPARLGEAARAYLLYKKNHFSLHVSIGSLALERVLDSLFFALFIIVPSIIIMPLLVGKKFFGQVDVMTAVRLGWIISISVLLLLLLYRLFPKPLLSIGDKIASRTRGVVAKMVAHLLVLLRESTEWMFIPRKALIITLLSPCIIVAYGLMILLLARTMGIHLDFWPAIFSSAILAFGVAVPSSPGFVGTLHLALRESLCIFGVDRDAASALAIVYHLITWIPVVGVGLYHYFKMDVSFREIRAARELEKTQG